MEDLILEKNKLEMIFWEEFEEDINRHKIEFECEYNYKNLLKKQYIEIMQELKLLGYEEHEFEEFCKKVDKCVEKLQELKDKSNHVKTPNVVSTALIKRTRQEVSRVLSNFESYR